MADTTRVGFIGQGYVGKNYADELESRGYVVVRYALEESYRKNKAQIAECDVVFIGVPTPTTPDGFDDSIVREAVGLIRPGSIAVIKSSVVPGTSAAIQASYPDRTVLYSPEFLSEATAREDVMHPFATIVGMTLPDSQQQAAELVQKLLPPAPFSKIMTSTEAEVVKYAHNVHGYLQVVLFNLLYDLGESLGCAWEEIREAVLNDPYMAHTYTLPVHKSGRGAGGNCFIKDLSAFRSLYHSVLPQDREGDAMFEALERKNLSLLLHSKKDLGLVAGVYGDPLYIRSANVQQD